MNSQFPAKKQRYRFIMSIIEAGMRFHGQFKIGSHDGYLSRTLTDGTGFSRKDRPAADPGGGKEFWNDIDKS